MRGQHGLDDILTDTVMKARADERFGYFPGTESRNASLFLITLRHRAECARYLVGRNFNFHFAGAFGIQAGTVLMRFVAMLVIMMMVVVMSVVVIMALLRLRGSSIGLGIRSCF